jgi:hypothetical protein
MGSIRPRPGARYDARVLFSCLNPVDWITAIYRRAEDVYRAVLTWSLGHLEEPGDEQEVRLHRPTPTFMSGPSRAAKPQNCNCVVKALHDPIGGPAPDVSGPFRKSHFLRRLHVSLFGH